MMESKLKVITSAFESIKRNGWCNIYKGHSEVIESLKQTLTSLDIEYSTHDLGSGIQFIVRGV
ncbi:hypothetical protein PQE71_gp039 [Bacillus phage Izhevsk]|uniref:Uncharacterized protein n=2 Tax=Tsamsavirus TaxID=3044849 RepID=A0A6H0X5X5_9CAUD|nr:hypothetical protein X915_gp044 [Bacillus phage vB_BanS-Tsamsa]YP_010680444.1 hypothetical protein PQE71_gp039 [Bacillus phage Izhevsk]AGI11948.1 hypothetical protein [Bacillus phage vB_BanS-Tsamsa]QIW89721.1 hypothetical protein Izhevsk_39 [Bacillus phage Izhevsk]